MDAKALDYFCRINPLARKIIDDQKLLQDAVGEEWNKLDWQKQEELLDDLMVDISVREKYAGIEKSHTYPSSFPNYKIETGEKIIVDFENDVSDHAGMMSSQPRAKGKKKVLYKIFCIYI